MENKMSNHTTGEQERWSLVPRALHFNIMCRGKVIYEGITSESRGAILCDYHNAAMKEAYEKGREYEYEKLRKAGCLDIKVE